MHTPIKIVVTSLLAIATMAAKDSTKEQAEAVRRVQEAKTVLDEIMASKDSSIPQDLLDKAHCAAIVPSLKSGAFIVGAKYGKGLLMCRKEGGGWSGPGTVRVEGGSVGFQIGGGETDLILLIMNKGGADRLVRNEFKIGAEAAAMAGPVGRAVQAETDAAMRAEMLGYSRSRGVFAGVALQGTTLREDKKDNEALYGTPATNREILDGKYKPLQPEVMHLITAMNGYSSWEKK